MIPSSKNDMDKLAQMVSDGEADGGMDITEAIRRKLRIEEGWITKNGVHILIADGDDDIPDGKRFESGAYGGWISNKGEYAGKLGGAFEDHGEMARRLGFTTVKGFGAASDDALSKGHIRIVHPNDATVIYSAQKDDAVTKLIIAKSIAANPQLSKVTIDFHEPGTRKLNLTPEAATEWLKTGKERVDRYAFLHQEGWEIDDSLFESGEDGDCTWITKGGVHICIGGDGTIAKGPAGLVGKKLGDASEGHAKLKEIVSSLPDKVNASEHDAKSAAEKIAKDAPPEVQAFVSAVSDFTDGRYDALTALTEEINTKGEQGALKANLSDKYKADFMKAKILNDAVKIAPEKEVHVWRGLGLQEKNPTLESFVVGQDVEMKGVKSWSHEKSVAVDYAQKNGPVKYFFELDGKAKGVSIASISQVPSEQEFATQGRFHIEGIETTQAGTKIFHVKQIGTF